MSAPGVIVEEGGVATVSVRPSPTIPVFIGAYLVDGARLPITHGCTKINHMADLRKFLSCSVSFSVTVSADKVPSLSSPVVQSSALAVANYFENGGGPCYLLPVALSSDSGQVEAIKLHPDISLVAAVMDNATVDIIEKIIPSLGQNPEYFYIHTPKTLASPPGIPATGKPHVASYHPFLHIKCSHWRDDSGITVSGYEGATTVAQLQTMAPDLYKQVDTLIRTEYAKYPTIVMPSGAAIAAAYCKTDRERGVWKAPANIVINNATPYERVTDAQQADLNDKGINAIRIIDGQTTIWGARTCEVTDRQWRYINVRRLFNQVERDIGDVMQRYMYEPNTPATWVRAKTSISNYLYNLWQLGALQGARPEDGYQVSLGLDESMSATDIEEGKMIACLRLAPSKPAEFIVLLFSQDMV